MAHRRQGLAALLLAAAWALVTGAAAADDRALQLTTADGATRTLPVAELDDQVGAVTLTVPLEFHFKSERRFVGYDLRTLLDAYGLPKDVPYELICEDGYVATLTPAQLNDPGARPLLAKADLGAPDGQHWGTYRIGERALVFDPFYLVWAPQSDGLDPEALIEWPWPYALVGIRPVDMAAQFAAATPAAEADPAVHAGFALFRDHCGKCHAVNGAGGGLGPSLTDNPRVSFLPKQHLVSMIADIGVFFTDSKMPRYRGRLSDAEISEVADYLRHMAGVTTASH